MGLKHRVERERISENFSLGKNTPVFNNTEFMKSGFGLRRA